MTDSTSAYLYTEFQFAMMICQRNETPSRSCDVNLIDEQTPYIRRATPENFHKIWIWEEKNLCEQILMWMWIVLKRIVCKIFIAMQF